MNELARIDEPHAIMADLFAPVDADGLAPLFAEYAAKRKRIHELAELFAPRSEALNVLHYFARTASGLSYMFDERPAVAALDADFWQRALNLTDVYDAMPQERRDEWNASITNRTTPAFEPAAVIGTLQGLLEQRHRFFAERVDGVFRALSGVHVTNRAGWFGRRMILENVYNGLGVNSSKAGYINDLRVVIAKFAGRDEPREWTSTHPLIEYARQRWGEWIECDGGTWRLKVWKKGTAHIEISSELALRLNMVLAYLHPHAIPAESRQRKNSFAWWTAKAAVRLRNLLPFSVVEQLGKLRKSDDARTLVGSTEWYGADKHVKRAAEDVLRMVGGVRLQRPRKVLEEHWQFPFDNPRSVLAEVRALGYVPDARSHQFYPTPDDIAAQAVELAALTPELSILEPSAGAGALACKLPAQYLTCVEISVLHCAVLRARGLDVVEGDFLDVQPSDIGEVDRVIMNPPFDRGQWVAHVEHAAMFVKPGGRIVAVLPEGAMRRDVLPEWAVVWTPIERVFDGTSINVVIMTAVRPR